MPSKSDLPTNILTLGTTHQVDENVSSFRDHAILMFIVGSAIMRLSPIHWALSFWMLPLVMTIVGVNIYFWSHDDVRSYSLGAVLPIAAGGFIAAGFDLTEEACCYAPIVIGGVWLLGIGSWTLFRYLRAHPKPNSGEEGRP